MKKYLISTCLFILTQSTFSQQIEILTFSEYLGYVKKYHPIVKQANLIINKSEAKLLKARGSFDPKIEVDYDKKKFKNTEYFNKLNSTFKIPTWYGIEVKGNFENNTGTYLNPESTVPNDGLYNVGVSMSLAKGLLINDRMATLRKAKLYRKQAKEDNQLLVNKILYNATLAYFKWLKTFKEKKVFDEFLQNNKLRLNGVKRSYELGERPAIDITEASIAFNSRKLNLEKARLNYIKATLQLSNYLWVQNTPIEVKGNTHPDSLINNYIDEDLQLNFYDLNSDVLNHPKLKSLTFKSEGLKVERSLQKNNLLPKIDLNYNFLTTTPEITDSFNTANYKAGVSISFPILLRKERANLKLTNLKLKEIDFEKQITSLTIKNKINTTQQEITSYNDQIRIASVIVSDYSTLLKGEERKFEIGESSLFLINSRESKLIENKLKVIALENLLLKSKGKLFNILGL